MRFTEALKHLTVHAGLYRPARRVIRRLRHADLVKFREHVAFYRRLPPGSLCFDVGANIGEVSEALLRAGHRVVAFEPNPDVLPELRARCDHHPAWRLLPIGVGSVAGVLPFYAAKASASSSFCPGWEQRELAGIHHVPVLPLELVIRSIGTPAYCKIDVEGFEEEVLAGLETPIALVSFEYHRDAPERAIGCLERLAGLGGRWVNVTPGERGGFWFPDWVPIRTFRAEFPDNVNRIPGFPWGDIYVRSEVGEATPCPEGRSPMPDTAARTARLCRLRAGLIRLGLPGEAADLLSVFVRSEVVGGIEADRRQLDQQARRALLPELGEDEHCQ